MNAWKDRVTMYVVIITNAEIESVIKKISQLYFHFKKVKKKISQQRKAQDQMASVANSTKCSKKN